MKETKGGGPLRKHRQSCITVTGLSLVLLLSFVNLLQAQTADTLPRLREVAVSQPQLGEAERAQTEAAIASDGDSFLAAWSDERISEGRPAVFATRIDGNGKVLDPTGIRLSDQLLRNPVPGVGSVGGEFLVRWADAEGRNVGVRISADGTRRSGEFCQASPGMAHAITWRGCPVFSGAKSSVLFPLPN